MLFLSCMILVVGLMAMDFINPSLPYIMQDLSTTQNATKGLVVTYLLAMSVAQLFYGSFSDNYGRRTAILLGFSIGVVGYIFSAVSQNIGMLYIGRFITALGLAGSPVISRALIADTFSDDASLKKAFSYFAMFSQISPSLAPAFGGIIQHYFSWRFSFYLLALLNLSVVIFLFKILPESYSATSGKNSFLKQLKVYLDLMRLRRFMILNLLSGLIIIFTLGFYSLSPFIFYKMGFNSIINGLMCIPYSIGVVLGAFSVQKIFYSFDSHRVLMMMIMVSFIFFLLTGVIFVWYVNLWMISVFAVLVGFMAGNMSALTLSLSMQGFQVNKGAASAVQAFIRYFFVGWGLLLCNFVLLLHFYQLIWIFLGVSLVMIIICIFEFRNRLYLSHQSIPGV